MTFYERGDVVPEGTLVHRIGDDPPDNTIYEVVGLPDDLGYVPTIVRYNSNPRYEVGLTREILVHNLEPVNEMLVIALAVAEEDEEDVIEPCPVCGREEAGFGECPESKAERQHSEEWIEPVDCPCCDTCRKKCADAL